MVSVSSREDVIEAIHPFSSEETVCYSLVRARLVEPRVQLLQRTAYLGLYPSTVGNAM